MKKKPNGKKITRVNPLDPSTFGDLVTMHGIYGVDWLYDLKRLPVKERQAFRLRAERMARNVAREKKPVLVSPFTPGSFAQDAIENGVYGIDWVYDIQKLPESEREAFKEWATSSGLEYAKVNREAEEFKKASSAPFGESIRGVTMDGCALRESETEAFFKRKNEKRAARKAFWKSFRSGALAATKAIAAAVVVVGVCGLLGWLLSTMYDEHVKTVKRLENAEAYVEARQAEGGEPTAVESYLNACNTRLEKRVDAIDTDLNYFAFHSKNDLLVTSNSLWNAINPPPKTPEQIEEDSCHLWLNNWLKNSETNVYSSASSNILYDKIVTNYIPNIYYTNGIINLVTNQVSSSPGVVIYRRSW